MKKSIVIVAAATIVLSSLNLNLATAAAKDDCDSTADGATNGSFIGAGTGIITTAVALSSFSCGPFAPACFLGVVGGGLGGYWLGTWTGKAMDKEICDKDK